MKKTVTISYYILFAVGVLLMLLSLEYADAESKYASRIFEEGLLVPDQFTGVNEDVREYYFKIEETVDAASSLVFFTTHQFVQVYEDGTLIYELEPGDTRFGRTPGSKWNFVDFSDKAKELCVRLEAAYPQVRDLEVTFHMEPAAEAMLTILQSSVIGVVVSVLDLLIGLILVIYAVVSNRRIRVGNGMLYLGMFALLMGTWTFNETEMVSILLSDRTAASFVGYILIMLMIGPFVLFVQEFLEAEDRRWGGILCILSQINFVICTALHMTGIREFKQTVNGTHFLMFAALCYLAYELVKRVHRVGVDRKTKANIFGMVVLAASFLTDIAAYHMGARRTDVFGRFGFMLYIVVLGKMAAEESLSYIEEGRKAEIYKELAMKDMPTGLYNRNAYDKWVNENRRKRGAAMITFDLNDLKKCNDTLGHTAGDKYIQDAAAMLQKVFEPAGRCFRIGGDEFCTVVEGVSGEWVDGRICELERLEREYNWHSMPVKMQIAHGYAFDEMQDRDMEETRARADVVMYENKKRQKEEHRKKSSE